MSSHDALADIQAHLERDGHNDLLKDIPPGIFSQLNGNIIIDPMVLRDCDDHFGPAYAFLIGDKLHFSVNTGTIWQPKFQRLMASQACLECAYRIDPFARLPLELLVEIESRKHVVSMLEYYLLVYLVDESFTGARPVPTYAHLEGMFRMLESAESHRPRGSPRADGTGRSLADGVQESLATEDASHAIDAAGFARKDYSAARSPFSDRVTPEVTDGPYKSVETVALEGPPNPKSKTDNHTSAIRDESEEDIGHMSSTNTLVDRTLQWIRSKIDETLLGYLPGLDGLEWGKDATYQDYIPLALRLAYFAESSKRFGDGYHSAWAYFKKEAGPTLELYVWSDLTGDYIQNGAMVSLQTSHKHLAYKDEFRVCQDPWDVVAITKYLFLLAAEAQDDERYGLITPDFQYPEDFVERLRAIGERRRDSPSSASNSDSTYSQEISHAPDRVASDETTPGQEQETQGSSQQMTLPTRTVSRSRRHVSTSTSSSEPETAELAPLRSTSPGSVRTHRSHHTVVSPPVSAEAQCTSPHVWVDMEVEEPGNPDGDDQDDFERTPSSIEEGLYPGYTPESSDGESEIHFLPPSQRNTKVPEKVALTSELIRKLSNLRDTIGGQDATLENARAVKEELEEELSNLIKVRANKREIKLMRYKLEMLNERIRTIAGNIEIFETSKADAEAEKMSWRSKKRKGMS